MTDSIDTEDPYGRRDRGNVHRDTGSEERAHLEAVLADIVRETDGIAFALLHGSFAEGLPYRDIDLAVYLEECFAGDPYGVLDRIHRRWPFPAEELDVRVLNEAPVPFRYHALKGRLVGLRNEELYGAVFESTVRTYLDEAPLRRRAIREAFA